MSDEKSKQELDLEMLYAQASGRKLLMAAGILHLAGVVLSIISEWQDLNFVISLLLSGEGLFGAEIFYLGFVSVAVVFQLVCGVSCIVWRNSIQKSKVLFGLAIAVFIVIIAPVFVMFIMGMGLHFNFISLALPLLHLFGAIKNRNDQKELEAVKRRELVNEQQL